MKKILVCFLVLLSLCIGCSTDETVLNTTQTNLETASTSINDKNTITTTSRKRPTDNLDIVTRDKKLQNSGRSFFLDENENPDLIIVDNGDGSDDDGDGDGDSDSDDDIDSELIDPSNCVLPLNRYGVVMRDRGDWAPPEDGDFYPYVEYYLKVNYNPKLVSVSEIPCVRMEFFEQFPHLKLSSLQESTTPFTELWVDRDPCASVGAGGYIAYCTPFGQNPTSPASDAKNGDPRSNL